VLRSANLQILAAGFLSATIKVLPAAILQLVICHVFWLNVTSRVLASSCQRFTSRVWFTCFSFMSQFALSHEMTGWPVVLSINMFSLYGTARKTKKT
jgi:hypothetical protein